MKLVCPTARLVNISVAEPPASGTVAISTLLPLKKLTDPVGIPADEVTVAVSVTLWPNMEGFCDEARAVAVATAFTLWTTGVEVDPLKLAEST